MTSVVFHIRLSEVPVNQHSAQELEHTGWLIVNTKVLAKDQNPHSPTDDTCHAGTGSPEL